MLSHGFFVAVVLFCFMREKLPSHFIVRQTEIQKLPIGAGTLLASSICGIKTLASKPPLAWSHFRQKRSQTPSEVNVQMMQTSTLREFMLFVLNSNFSCWNSVTQPQTPGLKRLPSAVLLTKMWEMYPSFPDSSHPALPRPETKEEKLLFQNVYS